VSGGMVSALEQLGLRDSIDVVYGSSAGAIAGAYFIAGQARYGTTIYYENINNSNFIDIRRQFKGRPAVSLEFLFDHVCVKEKPLDFDKVLKSLIPLHVIAASITRLQGVDLTGFQTAKELRDALRAGSSIPYFSGEPIRIGDDRYLDASIYESVPFKTALMDKRVTDVVVLLTRPKGDMRSSPNLIDKFLVAPHLRKLNVSLAGHYLQRASDYRSEIDELAAMQQNSGTGPNALVIQPPVGAKKVSPFERNRGALVRGAMDGFSSVYAGLGLKIPDLVEIITPFYRNES
jgi:predicted patatin/cPLA2 family phospholipase